MMKHIVWIVLVCGIMSLYACSSEKRTELQQNIPAISLSSEDKEKLLAFQKNVLSIEKITDKAINMAANELKNAIIRGEISAILPSIIDKAKIECLQAAESLAKEAVPNALPPVAKNLLMESKTGLILAYTSYAESFDTIRSFMTDKNPMALLEYRKKFAQAQEQLTVATSKLKQVMTAAGASQ